MKGVFKIILAMATMVVLSHNLAPHHHHASASAALGQWQEDHDGDDHADFLSTLQLDHSFSPGSDFAAVEYWDLAVLINNYWQVQVDAALVYHSYPTIAEDPPDRHAHFCISFRGPPSNPVA